jgi:peptide/nickel transport system permease protein
MIRHLLQRFLVALILVVGAASLVFVLLHAVPGDPVRMFLGDFATEDQIAAVRAKAGLDRPLPVQYLEWLGGIAHGDLGVSLAQTNMTVSRLIMERLPRTLEVAGLSILLGLLIGMPIGILAALRRGRLEDVGLTVSSLLSLSIPAYVSGTVLVLIFAVWLRWLPASGFVSFADNPVRHLQLLILPCVTLASHLAATIARMTRSSVLEVITQDYVRTARSKGLSERLVMMRHVLRNSLLPVTTTAGLQAGNLLGGTVIVEVIFSWPGLSTLMFQGIQTHDFPVVQGCVLVVSSLFIVITLLVDIFNGMLDPRVAHGGHA